jgi:hypothetical protein
MPISGFPLWGLRQPRAFLANDRGLACLAAAASFVPYLLTCARDITGEDAGELVTAAKVLGVAHPPGYPIWCLLGKVFTWIPVGSVAFRVALLSAVAGAVTVGFVTYLAISLTGSRPAAAAAGLLLAVSRDFWSQAVIPEVYTLNTAFLAAALYLTWRWSETGSNRTLYALAATIGISLTNHNTMGPLAVLFAAFVLAKRPALVKAPGVLPLAALCGALPLLLYLYLPIRAEARTIMNWGNPSDMLSVVDHVTRKQYAFEFTAESRSIPRMAAQSWEVLKAAATQWTPWLGWIALPGAWLAFKRDRLFALFLAAIFGATTLGFVVLLNFDLEREKLTAYRLFYLPAYVVAAIWIGLALDAAGGALLRLRPSAPPRLAWSACALAVAPLLLHWRENDKSSYRVVRLYTEAVLTTLPEKAIIFPSGDHASFPLIYVQGVEGRRLDLTIADKYGYTDPELLHDVPFAVSAGIGRIPSQAEDLILQDWLIEHTKRPVYFTSKRSLARLPGYRLEPDGLLYRLVRPEEAWSPAKDIWKKYDLPRRSPARLHGRCDRRGGIPASGRTTDAREGRCGREGGLRSVGQSLARREAGHEQSGLRLRGERALRGCGELLDRGRAPRPEVLARPQEPGPSQSLPSKVGGRAADPRGHHRRSSQRPWSALSTCGAASDLGAVQTRHPRAGESREAHSEGP